MIKRTLFFSSPAYLSLKYLQLEVQFPEQDKAKRTVPIEDIGVVVLEHQQITITNGALAALLENNVALIHCNAQHMPIGLMLPLEGGHTQSERFRYQIEASVPLKKQLWQQTVQAKIFNQAAVLAKQNVPIENMLYWAKSVKSGDLDNYEGRAAAYYWSKAFKSLPDFRRGRQGEAPNALLNYGYAILRALVARGLVSSGLLPTLGIFHRNKYNAYCLADDIMEPYRPYVDQLVIDIVQEGLDCADLNTMLKMRLANIGVVDVQFDKGTSPLMVGMQQTTASLAKCFEGIMRKINYPYIEKFDSRRTFLPDKDSATEISGEVYVRGAGGEESLPF